MAKKSKVLICAIIAIIVILLAIGAYFIFNNKTVPASSNTIRNIKKEVVTAENYDDIGNSFKEKEEDDFYYYSYACMFYMIEDGFSNIMATSEDESVMYQRIYGKTVQQLINEGKELMKENDMTIEKFKEELQKMATTD